MYISLYFDFTNSAVGYTVLGYNVALDKLQELDEAGQILEVVIPLEQFNDPLKAESSVGLNIGAAFKKDKWNAEINFFRNDFKNLIDTQIIARKKIIRVPDVIPTQEKSEITNFCGLIENSILRK